MRVGAGLAAALLVTGCGIFQPGAPDWVANRQPLEACADGVVEADSPEAIAGQACLFQAYRNGRGAELITSGRMETGASLVSYVRVHENGTVEMFLNLGDDPSAPGAWERFRCEELASIEPEDPQPSGLFTLTGCDQLPVP